MLLVIPCAFLKSRLKESLLAIIFLGKWQVIIVNCDVNPVLNLKSKAEKFEKRVTVKMIIERIIKALMNSKTLVSH